MFFAWSFYEGLVNSFVGDILHAGVQPVQVACYTVVNVWEQGTGAIHWRSTMLSPYFLHWPHYVAPIEVDSVYIWQSGPTMHGTSAKQLQYHATLGLTREPQYHSHHNSYFHQPHFVAPNLSHHNALNPSNFVAQQFGKLATPIMLFVLLFLFLAFQTFVFLNLDFSKFWRNKSGMTVFDNFTYLDHFILFNYDNYDNHAWQF